MYKEHEVHDYPIPYEHAVFESPITENNIPKCVKYALEHLEDGEEIVEFEQYSVGRPDGECYTDTWNLTTIRKDAICADRVCFRSWIINNGDEENYLYSSSLKTVNELSRLLAKIMAKNAEVA